MRQVELLPLTGLASFLTCEALPTVIGHQTLRGCRWTCKRFPQRLQARRPAELRWCLQISETELRQIK